MKLVYPAIFTPFDNGTGYTVEFPDLSGCVTEGDSMSDAITMATDAASGWVLTELKDGKRAPKASNIEDIQPPKGSFTSLIVLDLDAYANR